jgi:4-amino-4-deoxy-L-arabinose transferase-like glycosyltransferase
VTQRPAEGTAAPPSREGEPNGGQPRTLARRDVLAMLVVFVVALTLRLLYLTQAWDLPFFEFPVVDARSYDEWGKAIAAGDWLGDRTFYQAPAYPYFLGLVYTLFGHDLWTLHVVQMLLGAASCVLIQRATQRLFGWGAGLAAGLLLAAYAPALFFDGLVQKTNLGLLLSSALLLALTRYFARPTAATIAACGLIVGLLAITRENALIFVAVVPAYLLLVPREHPLPRRSLSAATFVLGVALVLVPVGLRNYVVGGTFAITTSQMGPNFYIGNNPTATGLYAPLLPGRHTPDFEASDARRRAEWESMRELTSAEVSSYWMDQSLAWIKAAPGEWSALLLYKGLLTINDFEVPDTEDIYVNRDFSWVLAGVLPFLRFGVLFPLAIAGVAIAWRERNSASGNAAGLLALLALVFAAAVAVFYVWGRYRFPLVPLLTPFAGLAIARGGALLLRGQLDALTAPAISLVVAAMVSNLPLLEREHFQHIAWTNLGNIMIRHQRWDDAENYLLRAAAIREESADLQFHFGVLRMNQKRYPEAERHLRQMLSLAEGDYRGHRVLSQVLRAQGRGDESKQHLLRSVELDPGRRRPGRPGAPSPESLGKSRVLPSGDAVKEP